MLRGIDVNLSLGGYISGCIRPNDVISGPGGDQRRELADRVGGAMPCVMGFQIADGDIGARHAHPARVEDGTHDPGLSLGWARLPCRGDRRQQEQAEKSAGNEMKLVALQA